MRSCASGSGTIEAGATITRVRGSSSSTPRQPAQGSTIDVIDFTRFFQQHIALRRLPASRPSLGLPAVVAKIDIEGAEHSVMPRLFATGNLSCNAVWLIEYHGYGGGRRLRPVLERLSRPCTAMRTMDDQSGALDRYPLPPLPGHGPDVWTNKSVYSDGSFWSAGGAFAEELERCTWLFAV